MGQANKIFTGYETVHIDDEDVVREISVKVHGIEIACFSAWVENEESEIMTWKIKPGQLSAAFLDSEFQGDSNDLMTWLNLEMRMFFSEINGFFEGGSYLIIED